MSYLTVKVVTDSGVTAPEELTDLGLQEAIHQCDRLKEQCKEMLQEEENRERETAETGAT